MQAVGEFNAGHPDAAVSADVCATTTTLEVGPAKNVSAAAIQSDTSLSATQKAEMKTAAAAAAIRSKHWSQFTTGGLYTATHNGTFYYDGTRVWVTVTTSGYKGSHNCFSNYNVGVDLTQNACNESGGSSSRNLYDSWHVAWVIQGSPVGYDVSMTATVKANGTISGPGATVG
jgi:hypothetical protein